MITEVDEVDEVDECEERIEEGDWTTGDGCKFYCDGKLKLDATELSDKQTAKAIARIMSADRFFPNIWYVSDHGNVSQFTCD